MRWLICTLAIVGTWSATPTFGESQTQLDSVPEWRHLPSGHPIGTAHGATYYDFALSNGSRAHLVVADIKKGDWLLSPSVNQPETAPTSVQAASAVAATNGGYFNLKDGGLSTSYVIVDGSLVADPTKNSLLMNNPKLKPFIDQILNRSELRIEKDRKEKISVEIRRHNTQAPKGARIVDSLQAGPQLLPTLDAEDEAFIRKNPDGTLSDSISAHKPAARTAFGVTEDGHIMLLCVAGKGQEPESSGIDLEELAALLKRLGCVRALNLDGGASTTMCVEGKVVCGKTPETRVKSVLLLQQNNR